MSLFQLDKMKCLQVVVLCILIVLVEVTTLQANEWIPVTGTETLQNFMSEMKAERTLPNGKITRGEYKADGTGILYSWGAEIPRTWKVKGEDQICVTANQIPTCYQIERNSDNPNLYRVRDVGSGKMAEFKITDGRSIVIGEPKDIDNKGGAATASAAEIAAELSNPNTLVATLTFKNQFQWFGNEYLLAVFEMIV